MSLTEPNKKFISILHNRREIWNKKTNLRVCYKNWLKIIKPFVVEGETLEVGAGTGLTKDIWEGEIITSDILETPWVDKILDAQDIDLPESSFQNILGIDIIHHLKKPYSFFNESLKILSNGGKLILIEPWITPISFIFYKLMHHEKIIFSHDYLKNSRNPWNGNMAVPNLIFSSKGKNFIEKYPDFEIEIMKKISFFDFQITGGFKSWSLVKNHGLYSFFLKMDQFLSFAMPFIGFRIIIVLKKI